MSEHQVSEVRTPCDAQPHCPNEDAILHYATERGLKNARLVYNLAFGWELQGEGRCEQDSPLVWAIATELGISRGCGGTNYAQIQPESF